MTVYRAGWLVMLIVARKFLVAFGQTGMSGIAFGGVGGPGVGLGVAGYGVSVFGV